MKAIEFSCSLLLNISRDSLTPALRLVLLSILSGRNTGEQVRSFMGIPRGVCTNLLNTLEACGMIACNRGTDKVYSVAAKGEEYVKQLFNFIQKES